MSITVVLADDHAVVRDGLKLLLEVQSDITVIGDAANGREALRQVDSLRPDVAILDIAMPELDGLEVAKQIQANYPQTRVMILSMHATSEHIFRALKSGVLGYLIKESAGNEVVKAVYAVHAGKRYLSQKISDRMIEDYVHYRNMNDSANPLASLSAREREVLPLVVEGKSSSEIADMLCLSPKTVDTYRSRLMRKLGVNDLAGLVKFAVQHGLTPPE
ncbi:MAG: response regulator transcription factor [Anaerolineales bacterium]|nr:response regulator transcription factor [Anaerolineales bacterium]